MDRLNQLGVKNKLIRDSDITIEPSDRTKLIKDAFGNTEDVLVISNHINAGGGTSFYVVNSSTGV